MGETGDKRRGRIRVALNKMNQSLAVALACAASHVPMITLATLALLALDPAGGRFAATHFTSTATQLLVELNQTLI